MFTFEQKNDVYDVIQYVAHFLTVNFLVKHLLLTLELLLFDYFDEWDHLGEYAQNVYVYALEVDDVKQMTQYVFSYLEGVAVGAEEQFVYDRIVDLHCGWSTSAECLLRERRALVKFLRSLMELLMKLLILWLASFWASIYIKFKGIIHDYKKHPHLFKISCSSNNLTCLSSSLICLFSWSSIYLLSLSIRKPFLSM